METKKPINIVLLIVAIIIGCALFKQFEFETLKFKNTGLGLVYMATFIFCMYFLTKKNKD